MKKLILLAVISLFTAGVNAQNPGPNELHCTEEAFTFRTDIKSGWAFSAPKIGASELAKNSYNLDWNFKFREAPPGTGFSTRVGPVIRADSFYPLITRTAGNRGAYNELFGRGPADHFKYLLPRVPKYPFTLMMDTAKFMLRSN